MTSLAAACRLVLLTADPIAKVKAARAAARAWRSGALSSSFDAAMPAEPARRPRPELLPPSRMPKRGRAGSEIYRDEIRHVAAGMKWFRFGCESGGLEPVATWKALVEQHFRGAVKPPFNDSARGEAGLSRDFYAGLAD